MIVLCIFFSIDVVRGGKNGSRELEVGRAPQQVDNCLPRDRYRAERPLN
jgi:hypothetical protein